MTPELVAEAIRLKLIRPAEAWRFLEVDPFAGLTELERQALTVRLAASGAPAVLPRRRARINGRLIPPPPEPRYRHGARNRPPKARKREIPA